MPAEQKIRYGVKDDWVEIQLNRLRFDEEPVLKGFDPLVQEMRARIMADGWILCATEALFNTQIDTYRRKLNIPGLTVEIWEGADLMFGCGDDSKELKSVVSIDRGPWPKGFQVLDFVAGLGAKVKWACEANYVRRFAHEYSEYDQTVVAHNTYTISYDIDQNFQSRRVITGIATVRDPVNPDAARHLITQKLELPNNWIRVNSKWSAAREAPNRLQYTIVDSEVFLRYPKPMTSGDATLEISIDGAKVDMSLNGTIKAPVNIPRSKLLDLFEKLANSYLGLNHRLVEPTRMQIGGSVFRNEINFGLTGKFALRNVNDIKSLIKQALTQLVADDPPFDINYQWVDSEWGSSRRRSLIDYIDCGVAWPKDEKLEEPATQEAAEVSTSEASNLDRVIEYDQTVQVTIDDGTQDFQPMDPEAKPVIQKLRPRTIYINEIGEARVAGNQAPDLSAGKTILPDELAREALAGAHIVIIGPPTILGEKMFTNFAWQRTHKVIAESYQPGSGRQVTILGPQTPWNPERRLNVGMEIGGPNESSSGKPAGS